MKIFAVGMNYIQHNKELDGALYKPERPVIFTKADSSLLKDGKPFFVPDWSEQVDYETELVVRICRLGKSIPERFAHRYYDAVTVGIDFTAPGLQRGSRHREGSRAMVAVTVRGGDCDLVACIRPEGEGEAPVVRRVGLSGFSAIDGQHHMGPGLRDTRH